MKFILILACIYLYSCNSAESTDIKSRSEWLESAKGKVYKTKRYYFFTPDSLFVEVARRTSFPPAALVDTMLFSETKKTSDLYRKGKQPDSVEYQIISHPGEQLEFKFKEGVKMWLKESTVARLYLVKGHPDNLSITGEAYIETPRSLHIYAGDSIYISVKPGAAFNLEDHKDGNITISLARECVTVTGKIKLMPLDQSLISAKHELSVYDSGTAYVIRPIDTAEIGLWKDAEIFRPSEATLSSIMNGIDKWYNTHTVIKTAPQFCYVTFPYATPLDSVLDFISKDASVQFDRRHDSIFVSMKRKD